MRQKNISSLKEEELKKEINPEKLPRHIAIIMDGNGRWAKKRLYTRIIGHREGIKSVRAVIEASVELKIDVLTLYAFSVENWARPQLEVNTLMDLLVEYLRKELPQMMRQNIRFMSIGDNNRLPAQVREELRNTINQTAPNTGMILNLALNYSGQQEIVEAVKKVASDYQAGTIQLEDITPDRFSQYLFTRELPDPDLLIRTSGEMRLSNFLLWQLAYAEFWITPTLWPDFGRKEFYEAILNYQNRERRFGRVIDE